MSCRKTVSKTPALSSAVPLGPLGKHGRLDLAMYASTAMPNGKTVLWYPDRKFFLPGKILDVQ